MSPDNESYREDVPEGWRPLFDQLVVDLGELNPAFRISQAKQKFGELRVYLDRYPPGASDLIDAATRKSRETCEVCGSPGALRKTRGYYQTLCDAHGAEAELAAKSPISARFRFGSDGLREVDVSSQTDDETE